MKHLVVAMAALALLGGSVVPAASAKAPVRPAPAKVDWTRTVARTPEGGVRMGNPAAKVKLIEIGSRTCPTCARFTVEGGPALKAGFVKSGQVSYEFRDFPVHGAIDLGPILLGRCVPVRAFFPLLEAMMANRAALVGRPAEVPAAKRDELAKATPNQVATYLAGFYGYTDFAVKAGVPRARALACLADRAGVDAIVAQSAAAEKAYTIAGTPTFVVNGVVADKVYDWPALEPVLRAAGAR